MGTHKICFNSKVTDSFKIIQEFSPNQGVSMITVTASCHIKGHVRIARVPTISSRGSLTRGRDVTIPNRNEL